MQHATICVGSTSTVGAFFGNESKVCCVYRQAHPLGPVYSFPKLFYPATYKLLACLDHHSILPTEAALPLLPVRFWPDHSFASWSHALSILCVGRLGSARCARLSCAGAGHLLVSCHRHRAVNTPAYATFQLYRD